MIGQTDIVTVVNKTDDGYISNIVTGVFWYGEKAISSQGNGIAISAEPSVIFPFKSLANYTDGEASTGKYALKRGDYVILGRASDISTMKDINQYENVMTIKSVSDHRKGSSAIQHITVR